MTPGARTMGGAASVPGATAGVVLGGCAVAAPSTGSPMVAGGGAGGGPALDAGGAALAEDEGAAEALGGGGGGTPHVRRPPRASSCASASPATKCIVASTASAMRLRLLTEYEWYYFAPGCASGWLSGCAALHAA